MATKGKISDGHAWWDSALASVINTFCCACHLCNMNVTPIGNWFIVSFTCSLFSLFYFSLSLSLSFSVSFCSPFHLMCAHTNVTWAEASYSCVSPLWPPLFTCLLKLTCNFSGRFTCTQERLRRGKHCLIDSVNQRIRVTLRGQSAIFYSTLYNWVDKRANSRQWTR